MLTAQRHTYFYPHFYSFNSHLLDFYSQVRFSNLCQIFRLLCLSLFCIGLQKCESCLQKFWLFIKNLKPLLQSYELVLLKYKLVRKLFKPFLQKYKLLSLKYKLLLKNSSSLVQNYKSSLQSYKCLQYNYECLAQNLPLLLHNYACLLQTLPRVKKCLRRHLPYRLLVYFFRHIRAEFRVSLDIFCEMLSKSFYMHKNYSGSCANENKLNNLIRKSSFYEINLRWRFS